MPVISATLPATEKISGGVDDGREANCSRGGVTPSSRPTDDGGEDLVVDRAEGEPSGTGCGGLARSRPHHTTTPGNRTMPSQPGALLSHSRLHHTTSPGNHTVTHDITTSHHYSRKPHLATTATL
ncbi:hypothetical protein Pcinc_029664 [Petrolisthes cinctipes]|uniref:Uncharacterized protein n=1 Tax=Petrolisthes cinctipes TaxID=88211 RepID=A0AAE1EZV7_PETCI|nr:hypothetical protein Pcinc_029664 [Petrolisthes cinctipes]